MDVEKSDIRHRNPPSTFAIGGHPLHPMFVTLPIGFLVGMLLSDIGFQITGDPFWARASLWLTGAGLVTGALAAVGGMIDYFGDAGIRRLNEARLHFAGNAIALILVAISFYLRLETDEGSVTATQLVLSICIVALLGFTGWLGGEMIYKRRVAVEPPRADRTTL